MVKKSGDECRRQHRHAALAPLALSDRDLLPLEVEILDTQFQALEQAHAAAIEQGGDQSRCAVQVLRNRFHF